MDVGSIFLVLTVVLLVVIFVGRPFLRPQKESVQTQAAEGAEHQRSSLLAQRDRLLTALQELDFDQRLGKIPAEDYPEMRSTMLQEAALVLRKLDEIQGSAQQESVEDRIEKVIAARRADAAVVRSGNGAEAVRVAARPNDELENQIASRKRERQEKSTGFCPKCGKPALKSDRFCSRCGTTL